MSSFDVRVFAIRRRPGRKTFEVRWRVADRDKSRSFTTRALADGYRAELVRAARQGQAFDPATGEPAAWIMPVTVSWYQHAVAYAEMKWPRLAPHSRASLADALATITPLLIRETSHRPPDRTLRAALYRYAFNPQERRSHAPDPVTGDALAWMERASLPVSQLTELHIIRAGLDGLCTLMDGSPAAASTVSRKRAAFHGALGYAVERGLLPANPLDLVRWHAARAAVAISPATVASPAQVQTILAHVDRVRPELAAFFGCLYYAALRPEEAVALRRDDLVLTEPGRCKLVLTTSCPRTGTAWTSTGTPHEPRGLKHRPAGAIRVVPIPSILARMLRRHLRHFGTAPDGRLFRGTRGGMLSESVYGRTWHTARRAALGPELAATALLCRPYDLRHAALSLWLNASGAPAEVAARAGNSARVLHEVYLHCINGHEDLVTQQIEDALEAGASSQPPSPCVKASGCTHRRHHPRPCPPYVREPVSSPAHSPRPGASRLLTPPRENVSSRSCFRSSEPH